MHAPGASIRSRFSVNTTEKKRARAWRSRVNVHVDLFEPSRGWREASPGVSVAAAWPFRRRRSAHQRTEASCDPDRLDHTRRRCPRQRRTCRLQAQRPDRISVRACCCRGRRGHMQCHEALSKSAFRFSRQISVISSAQRSPSRGRGLLHATTALTTSTAAAKRKLDRRAFAGASTCAVTSASAVARDRSARSCREAFGAPRPGRSPAPAIRGR